MLRALNLAFLAFLINKFLKRAEIYWTVKIVTVNNLVARIGLKLMIHFFNVEYA